MIAVGCSSSDHTATIERDVKVPADLEAQLACTSGTTVTLSGGLKLSGLAAKLILRNNQKGTHEATEDLAAAAVLIPADQTIQIPAQTVHGDPVANPVVTVQLLDKDGNPVSAEIALGACGAAAVPVSAQATIDAHVDLSVTAAGCSNHPGPTITVTGAVTFSGLQARFTVRDGAGGTVAGQTTAHFDVEALADGKTVSIPKQPVRGGVGGNPWIWAQLRDGDQGAVSDEIFIGRCQDIAGAGDGSETEKDAD
jgi:hypothetical protein